MIYHWEHIEPYELLHTAGFTPCGLGEGPGHQIVIDRDSKGYPIVRIHAIPTGAYINMHYDEGGGRWGHKGRGYHPDVLKIARKMRRTEAARHRAHLSTRERWELWGQQLVCDIISVIRDEVRRKLQNTIKSIKRTAITWRKIK